MLPSSIENLLSVVEELFDWKESGYEVNYVSSSNVVNNKNNLKNYIENNPRDLGEPSGMSQLLGTMKSYDIPTWNSLGVAIMEKVIIILQLGNNDQYPEVFRISLCDTFIFSISKLLNYGLHRAWGNWFTRACLAGDLVHLVFLV